MGWWNESIYGGDAPLLWKEKIYEFCKIQEYGKNNKVKPIPKKNLLKNIEKLREMIDVSAENTNDKNIGYQVLGAVVIHSGFDFDENYGLKDAVLESIDNDEWSKENALRNNVLKNFKKIIKEYDPNEPVDIETVNVFEENEDAEDESVAKEFKEMFGIMNARIKKIKSNIEEKSGIKEFDEGYETAASEEIDFLTDFKELMERQEQMGILLERISKGLTNSNPSTPSNETAAKTAAVGSASASVGVGKDIQPG